MSYQFVEDLQKKACPKVTVSQACRVLEVSRSGYYANAVVLRQRMAAPVVCAASVCLKAAFAASHKAYGQSQAAHCHGRAWFGHWQTQSAHFDAAQWLAPCLECQVRQYDAQQTHDGCLTQCAEQTVRASFA